MTPMASSASKASKGKKTNASAQRARSIHNGRSRSNEGAAGQPTRNPSAMPAKIEAPGVRTPIPVQKSAGPGSHIHPAIRSARIDGASRLRRRLSRIFQRLSVEKSLGIVLPFSAGTRGMSQGKSCQSPRIQRCWRSVEAR